MKLNITKITAIIIALATLLASIPLQRAAAAGNILLFSPSSSQMNINATFTVSIRAFVESAAPNGTASGTVIYPANLLKVIATSTSGSSYGNPAIAAGSGSIGFSGSRSPGPSGMTQVFSVTFQAIGAGRAPLNFSADSTINNSGTNRNSAAFTIIDPNPPAPQQPQPPKPQPVQPQPQAPVVVTPPPAPVETPPTTTDVKENTSEDSSGVITDVNISSAYNSSTVTWRHSREQANTSIVYGGSRTTMTTKADIGRGADGTFTAKLIGLKPGVRYYFTITSEDATKKASTWDSMLITKGYPVVLVITENDAPAASATVRIGSITRTTGKDGRATFDLAEGNYSAAISTKSSTGKSVTFSVVSKQVPTDDKAPSSQQYTFNLESSADTGGNASSILTFIFVLLVGGAVLVLGVLGYLAYRRRQYEGSYGGEYAASGPSVMIDDGYNWQQPTQAPMPPPPTTPQPPQPPGAAPSDYEEPKDMFELARERERQNRSDD